ncbi:hypothetical protein MESS4_600007 [Mesorhizobium sp. STM 4661]|nr:hypothetical protein MESS4_600007 [Mesorhizobium sp. STM 4661]
MSFSMSGTVCRAWFRTTFYRHPVEASHGRITGFVQVMPVATYLQRLDGRQSISNAENSGAADRANFLWQGMPCPPWTGRHGRWRHCPFISFFGQSLTDSHLSHATIIYAKQSEMPIRTFFSEVLAAREPAFEDSAETEQSNWLEERGTLTAGKLQRTSDRQSLPVWRVLQEKGTMSGTGTGLHKGAARMSRIRLSQPQGAKRRDGQATAATVTRCCSKGDVAVRNSVEPLG